MPNNTNQASADTGIIGGEPSAPATDKDPVTAFRCSICTFSVDACKFGTLHFDKVEYTHPVYYMRDPFEPPDVHKHPASYTIDDFVMLGAHCYICEQPSCADEECSLVYRQWYCRRCAERERHSFPRELVQSLERKQGKKQPVEYDRDETKREDRDHL
jgi:hypothetical protein